jgi:dihydrofolate reductase
MRKLGIFNFTTLNGLYKGLNEEINWHVHGPEEQQYSIEGLRSESMLLFGRVTYQMMVSYWTTPMAQKDSPIVAEGMNKAEKIVFSRTLKTADWNNTRVMNGNIVEEIKKLKQTPGKDMTILGSGSIVTLFAEYNLIDEYMIMIDPVAIGEGVSIFKGIKHPLNLKLTSTKTFKSGVVLLCYEPK